MSLEVWALFVLTESLLCLTPGPAVLLVVAQALTRGAAASGWATLGILAGNALYFALSATGLGAVLLASYELFSLVRCRMNIQIMIPKANARTGAKNLTPNAVSPQRWVPSHWIHAIMGGLL